MTRFLLPGFVLAAALPAAADTYEVCRTCRYRSVDAAVQAALGGGPDQNRSGNAVIQVAAGTWKGTSVAGPTPNASGPIGNSYLHITGDPAGGTILSDNQYGGCGTLIATNNAAVMISNLTVQTADVECQSALFAQNNAIIQVRENVTFGFAKVQHMHAEANAVIEVGKSYRVSGSAYNHWGVSNGGYVQIDPLPLSITFTRPVSFQHFAYAQSTGNIFVGKGVTLGNPQNASADYRYVVLSNGVIDMDDSGVILPGTRVEAKTGGQYVGR